MQYADFATYAIALCDRMFTYNQYPYNCASVQRTLLAPKILNESFLKCRYFTALLTMVKPEIAPFDPPTPNTPS